MSLPHSQCSYQATLPQRKVPVWGLVWAEGSDFGWQCARICWASPNVYPKTDPEPQAPPLSWGTVRAVCAELEGPLLALSNIKQQQLTIVPLIYYPF